MLREQDGWAVEGAMVRERDDGRTTAQHPDAQLIMLLSPFLPTSGWGWTFQIRLYILQLPGLLLLLAT